MMKQLKKNEYSQNDQLSSLDAIIKFLLVTVVEMVHVPGSILVKNTSLIED